MEFFDSNGFRDRLAELMAISGTSQDPVCNATWMALSA